MNALDNIVTFHVLGLRVTSGPQPEKVGKINSVLYFETASDKEAGTREMEARAQLAEKFETTCQFRVVDLGTLDVSIRTLLTGGFKKWETPDKFRPEDPDYTGYWAPGNSPSLEAELWGAEDAENLDEVLESLAK